MANFVSMLRVIIALIAGGLLFIQQPSTYWVAFALTIIAIWMDGLDGYIARKFNECSKAGALFDIMSDRMVENIYWIIFAVIGWIPVAMPLIVIIRGTITDGIRSMALEQGYTAFGSSTMMQGKISKFIVASNFSRFSYAVLKAVAFALIIAGHVPNQAYSFKELIANTAWYCAVGAVALCVLRGLPVLFEGKKFLFPEKNKNE